MPSLPRPSLAGARERLRNRAPSLSPPGRPGSGPSDGADRRRAGTALVLAGSVVVALGLLLRRVAGSGDTETGSQEGEVPGSDREGSGIAPLVGLAVVVAQRWVAQRQHEPDDAGA
ncbi:MAG: hypothetical protein ABEJ30_00120 [Halorientalis sp.]